MFNIVFPCFMAALCSPTIGCALEATPDSESPLTHGILCYVSAQIGYIGVGTVAACPKSAHKKS